MDKGEELWFMKYFFNLCRQDFSFGIKGFLVTICSEEKMQI